jgi:hypothetical protein
VKSLGPVYFSGLTGARPLPLQLQFLEQVWASLEHDARNLAELLDSHVEVLDGLDRAKPGHDLPCHGCSLAWVEGGQWSYGRTPCGHVGNMTQADAPPNSSVRVRVRTGLLGHRPNYLDDMRLR